MGGNMRRGAVGTAGRLTGWAWALASILGAGAAAAGPPSAAVLAGELLVQLRVADLDRSIGFYTGTLGCRLTERRDDLRFAHLDCGLPGLQLGLSAGGEQPVAGTVVLNFRAAGGVEAARRELERRGVAFTGPTEVIPGKVALAPFRDPDGYRLRLSGPPTPGD